MLKNDLKLCVNHQFIAPSLYNQITQLIFITDIFRPKIKCRTPFGGQPPRRRPLGFVRIHFSPWGRNECVTNENSRHSLFVRGQSFSVKTSDRSRNGCQVIRLGAGNDFRGPSVPTLPLPSRVSFSHARFNI